MSLSLYPSAVMGKYRPDRPDRPRIEVNPCGVEQLGAGRYSGRYFDSASSIVPKTENTVPTMSRLEGVFSSTPPDVAEF